MGFSYIRIWLPLSFALHLLLVPVLAWQRAQPPASPPLSLVIVQPTAEPPPPPQPRKTPTTTPVKRQPPRLAPRITRAPQTSAKATTPSSRGVTRAASLPPDLPRTARLSSGPTSWGRSTPDIDGPLRTAVPIAPGAPPISAARPGMPTLASGGAGPTPRGTLSLPAVMPHTAINDRGSWVTAPGDAGGTGSSPMGLAKAGPGRVGDPAGTGTGGGNLRATTALTPGVGPAASPNAGVFLAQAPEGPLGGRRSGTGFGTGIAELPTGVSGIVTSPRGTWIAAPGAEGGHGTIPGGLAKAGPGHGAGGKDPAGYGGPGPVYTAAAIGPGGSGGVGRADLPGIGLPSGPPAIGNGDGELARDIGRLPFAAAGGRGAGHGGDAEMPGGGSTSGLGYGSGPERALPSYGASLHGTPTVGFPMLALKENLSGSVVVTATVNPDGTVQKAVTTTSSQSDVLDNAAVRGARALSGIIPAMQNGVPVVSTIRLKFVFADNKVTVTTL